LKIKYARNEVTPGWRRRGATCCRNSGALRTFPRRRSTKIENPQETYKNRGGGERGTKNTLLSFQYHHTFVSTRLRQLARRARSVSRGRAPLSSRGRRWRPLASVARVNAFPHRHTGRGAVVCACEVVVVCRRFYYEPIITPPLRRRRSVTSAAVAGEVTAAVTVDRPRWEGGTCQSQATGSLARNAFRPLTGYLARSSHTIIILYKIRFARRPSLDDWLCHFFFLESKTSILLYLARARAPKHRFHFSHHIGKSNLKWL